MRSPIAIAAALLFACGSKNEDSGKTPAGQGETTAAGNRGAPARPVEPAESSRSTEPTVPVDCEALVTAEDLKDACDATLEVRASALEGKGAGTRCARTISAPGSKAPLVRVLLSVFANRDAAEHFATLDKDVKTSAIEGLGDRAWKQEKAVAGLTKYDVGVIKSNLLLKVGVQKSRSNPDPPCTLDQLAELAKLIAPRLP